MHTLYGPEQMVTSDRRPEPDSSAVGRDLRQQFDEARKALADARGVIERGWLQNGWYRTRPPAAPAPPAVLRRIERSPTIDDLQRACLVAAVVVASGGGRPRSGALGDAGPALDLLWDAMWDARGIPGAPVAGRAAPPAVRVCRARELTTWNDAPGRTRGEVLGVLDNAISRGILGALGAAPR